MSIIRSLSILAVFAGSLTAVSAQAATPGASHSVPPHVTSQTEAAKHAACERVWAAQKVRHGARQAFVAACVAKG